MHVFVGDDVEGDVLRFEPLDEVHVGAQLPEPGVGRADVDQRAETRGVTDARPVVVDVVHRVAVLGVAVEIAFLRRHHVEAVGEQLVPGLDPAARVAVRHVAGRGDEEGERRGGAIAQITALTEFTPIIAFTEFTRRAHDEGDVVLLVPGRDPGGVEAARRAGGDFQFEIGVPFAVVQRVIEEVDGGVLIRRMAKIKLVASPGGAAHGANREVDQLAVGAVGRDVDDLVRLDRAGEVPGGADVGA